MAVPSVFVNVRFVCELEEHEDVPEEARGDRHGPEHSRVPRDGMVVRVEGQIVSLHTSKQYY